MPKDPKGQKHPGDVGGAAIQVSPVANGDRDGRPANDSQVEKDVEAGGAVPAKSETSARRKEIDNAAASPRWEG